MPRFSQHFYIHLNRLQNPNSLEVFETCNLDTSLLLKTVSSAIFLLFIDLFLINSFANSLTMINEVC